MKTFIKLAAACALATSLVACGAPKKTLEEANMALKSAMSANIAAKKVGYEWRDTGKIIKKARKAKAKGDFNKAVKLAGQAERQAENAVRQYNQQKNAQPQL